MHLQPVGQPGCVLAVLISANGMGPGSRAELSAYLNPIQKEDDYWTPTGSLFGSPKPIKNYDEKKAKEKRLMVKFDNLLSFKM